MRRSVVETMKRFLAAIAAVAAVCCLVPSHVQAGALNGSANLVLGQNDFTHNGANIVDGKAANGQHSVLDPTTGRLYVSDWMNNRVLWWNSANSLTNGQSADGALGQQDLISSNGATTQTGMNGPTGIYADSGGNLWVADTKNNRVIRFSTPIASGNQADLVLGQADYTHNSQGGLQRGMYNPYGVCVDTSGCVWVADTVNNRVLKFNPPFSNNMNASLALGQINYTSGVPGFSSRRHE